MQNLGYHCKFWRTARNSTGPPWSPQSIGRPERPGRVVAVNARPHEFWQYVTDNEFPTQPFRHTAHATDAAGRVDIHAWPITCGPADLRPAPCPGLAGPWLAGAHTRADPETQAAGGRDPVTAAKAGTPQTRGGTTQALVASRTARPDAGRQAVAAPTQSRACAKTPARNAARRRGRTGPGRQALAGSKAETCSRGAAEGGDQAAV